jgi:manganese-dependent ADP-ribose/CDP-alcohol diphosphatase
LQEKSEQALTDILQAFSLLPHPTYHMLGNHCLYNLPRARLNQRLGITPLLDLAAAADGASYYVFSPHPAWLFVVLDAYDVSLLGWPDSHPRHLQAEALLAKNNPNKVRGTITRWLRVSDVFNLRVLHVSMSSAHMRCLWHSHGGGMF